MALFAGARLKVKRADQHIDEFNSVLQAFIDSGFYEARIDTDTKTGYDTAYYGIVKTLPEMIPCVLGDAIHNLHSALDVMIWEAVCRSGGTPNERTVFPFGTCRNDVIGRLKKGEANKLGPDIIERIFADTIKPYPGGNDALLALHCLDISDKHRLVIPVSYIASAPAVRVHGSTKDGLIMSASGTGVSSITVTGKIDVAEHEDAALFVLFDKGYPFENEAVFPTLKQLSQLVAGVVQTVEEVFV